MQRIILQKEKLHTFLRWGKGAFFRGIAQTIDLVIPFKCIRCGRVVEKQAGLCPECWGDIAFIVKPFCARCGLPFEFEIEEGALCPSCSSTPPFYTTARAVFAYTGQSKGLILRFKHLDGINGVPLFSQWMAQKADYEGEALCVPVPLHWTRLFMRTYNQAALLAQEVARIKGWLYVPQMLLRKKRTPSQGHLSKKERIENVRGAFRVSPSHKTLLKGRGVILIDDVLTTGATLNACARVLRRAGAKEVHALTLGRV